MDKLDSIRKRQQIEGSSRKTDSTSDKKTDSASRRTSGRGKKKKRRSGAMIIRIVIFVVLALVVVMAGVIVWATWGMDFSFQDQFSRSGMNLTSVVYYEDEEGEQKYFERLIADQNRIWVDGENVPQNLKDAFVAIEDQRFYSHSGFDIKRTTGAALNVLFKGDSSYGGSTITQQLVKNITADSERTGARKIREIVRSVIIEFRIEKDEILELYMNSIYLGHGANGVQAAAKVYFDKDVKDLSLVECAAIAGITKYPSKYDPIIEPESNKQRRQLVLDKMYELEYITKEEYDEASNTELETISEEEDKRKSTQSYFVDYLYEELMADFLAMGYDSSYATDLIYNGGLKIISTVNPKIQKIMDDLYVDGKDFPWFGGETPQSAMVITDPSTGYIKGIVGGVGEKTGARVLNRAAQTRRQPGSTIKPISVYGPAIDNGVITIASSIQNTPLKMGEWEPHNANSSFFSAYESVRNAVAQSYNLPAIRVLEEMGTDVAYDYLTNKMHINLLPSDKDFAPLSLGGLGNGVTVMELNSAYSTFANGGEYIKPTSYTKVYDANGNLLIDKTPEKNRVFSQETAYIMTEILSGVVKFGTAAGYQIPGMATGGKTGSSDEYKDRWFAGFTPYYSGAVWVGYDEPKVISAGGNPAAKIWYSIMKKIHSGLEDKSFTQPVGVDKVFTCSVSGDYGTAGCPGTTDYVNTRLMSGYCDGNHSNIIGTPGEMPGVEDEEENTEGEGDETEQGDEPEDEQGDATHQGAAALPEIPEANYDIIID